MDAGQGATPRQQARRHLTTALALLVAAVFLLRLGSLAGNLAWWGFFLTLLYAAGAAAWWAVAALRNPRPDPWAYDPDLDGPIAQEIEGRSYPPPPSGPPVPRGQVMLWLVLAAVFLLAGVWLVDVAGSVYGTGNGAEAPSLAALALYLCAACFMAAGPCMAWLALRARP
ncbi:MAG: hypothetical protein QOI63_364 [Thermoplasmata archaeon]|jgi:hypothetical protein|nr:hypothetical protein [Thermoplasmata archaeon]